MKYLKYSLIFLLVLLVNRSFGQRTPDSLYTKIQNDTLIVCDLSEVNKMFSPVITCSIKNDSITIVEHDTSSIHATGVCLKRFCTPIPDIVEGHYFINVYYQYDVGYWYTPDSLYFRGAIEVDFYKSAVEKKRDNIPENYALRCYPNPFNSDLMIDYQLKKPSHITIDIFNELGQHIEQIEKSAKDKGSYRILYNCQSLKSGIYMIRIMSDEFTQTEKVTLIK